VGRRGKGTLLNGYGFVLPVEVLFRDLDSLGHVNNAVYLSYMEQARMEWWRRVWREPDLRKIDMILARTEIDYRRPVGFGERLRVGVRCASMRRTSFVLEFRCELADGGALVAEARKVLVHYDYAAGRPTPLTPEQRAFIRAQDPGVVEET
jgi:acyl-CoA thioester hydrolase